MLYRTTLNPGVFEDQPEAGYWNTVVSILQEMNRDCLLLSLWDGRLEQVIASRLQHVDERFRPKVKALLSRLRDRGRIIRTRRRSNRPPSGHDAWLDEALALPDIEEAFLFARERHLEHHEKAKSHPSSVAVELAAMHERWSARLDTHPVTRCTADVLPFLEPILLHSKRVWIIDYCIFKVLSDGRVGGRRFFPAIRKCLEIWAANDLRRFEFLIHTEVPEGYPVSELENYVAAWRPSVRRCLPRDDSTVAIRFWRSTPGREFHRNRFLSSEIACVQIGKGFDIQDKPGHRKPDLLTLLHEEAARSVEGELSRYKLFAEISLR